MERVLRAIRGRSPAELRERLAQQGSILLERAGVVPRERRLTGEVTPRLPTRVDDLAFAERFRERWPDEARAIVERADRLLAGEYDLLGYAGLRWGAPPDWQLDPVSGRRAPLVHWSRVPYLDVTAVGDHKVTWELNRHQWLVTLAQAWCLTRRDAYAAHVAAMLAHWLDTNPPKRGINWASSLELAFRAIAWCWTLRLLSSAQMPDDSLRARLLASLDLQGRHVERYLSTWFSPNTHLTGEALALLYLGVALPALPCAARWRERGWEILAREAGRQIRDDGVYFEQTTWYQGYTVDFYLHAIRLRRAAGGEVPESLLHRVRRATDALVAIVRPDGRIPLLGDDDGGRLLPLRPGAVDDFRDTLALAALVFDEPAYKPVDDAPASALAWIASAEECARYDRLTPETTRAPSQAFPDGGWYVVRDERAELLLDGGPHGSLSGAHAHADALALVLAVDGRPALADPGAYTYLGPERDDFRGTAAHNTVEVDGEHSSLAGTAFRWERFARSEVLRWFDGGAYVLWEAVHDGYRRLPQPVLHRRIVLWLRNRYGLVCDILEGSGRYQAVTRFHAPAGAAVAAPAATLAELSDSQGRLLRIVADRPIRIQEGWTSVMYGRRERSCVALVPWTAVGHAASLALLVPGASPDGPGSCQTVEAEGGAAWSIQGAEGKARLLLRSATEVRSANVACEADLCWAREDDEGTVREVIAAGVGRVRIDDEVVMTVRGGCARAWRDAQGRWAFEES